MRNDESLMKDAGNFNNVQEIEAFIREQFSSLSHRIGELENLTNLMRPLGPRQQTDEETREQINKVTDRLLDAINQHTAIKAATDVDPPKMCTTTGDPVDKVRAEQTSETGQHKAYIVLCSEEREKGFVRPYRDSYRHSACGSVTTMGRSLSETYARDPSFYGATFCVSCNRHLPVSEFVWTEDGEQVGS